MRRAVRIFLQHAVMAYIRKIIPYHYNTQMNDIEGYVDCISR